MKMKLFSSFILSLCAVMGFSQTILYQAESTARTVQDPQTVVLTQGFLATSSVSNPFVVKIGPATENPGGGPSDSNSGANNPSGTPSEQVFHDTKGNIEVSGTGQLQFTLPVALPPGVKTVAPQISLVYTNGTPNGIAGYGWNISGISSISRIGKNIERYGEIKGVQLDYSDYYSFNGQRLILKSGEYGKDGAEYMTEKYSNIKIKSIGSISFLSLAGEQGPEYWEVTFEDGSKAWYGMLNTNSNSLIAESRTPLDYNITKWQDAQGNIINYTYEQIGNVSEIKSITWGGNVNLNTPSFNEIIFNYTNRNLREQSYISGGLLTQSRILTDIVVKTNNSPFKKYEIQYAGSNTNYQFVKQIIEYNSQNEPANPIIFENEIDATATNTFNQNSRYDDLLINNYNLVKGDFNGDGKLDAIKGNTLMLSRLEGNGNFVNFTYEGDPISSGTTLYNNILKQSQSLLTISYDRTVKKMILKEYGLENNASILYKSTDFISTLFDNALYGNLYNPNIPVQNDQTYYNSYIADDETYEGNYNGYGYSQFVIRIKNVRNVRKFIPPREGGPKVTTTKYLYSEEYFYFDTVKNVVRRLDGLDHHAKIVVSDFDGDGKTDILQITGSELKVYSFDADNNIQLKFSTSKESLDDKLYLGDFNGDNKTDIIAPIADGSADWRMYISTGKGFRKEYYSNLFLYQPSWQGAPRKNRNIQRTYTTSDLNKDGKSDFTIFESQVWYRDGVTDWNDPDSSYGFNYLRNEGVDTNGKPIFSTAYNITPKELNWDGEDINYSMYGEHYIPLFGNFRIAQLNTDFAIIHKTKLITWSIGNKLDKISKIRFITQGGVKTEIQYSNLMDNTANIYKPAAASNLLNYPYVNVPENANFNVVSKLIQGARSQEFRYRDLIAHMNGRGMIGFRQMARSTFFAGGYENTKIWNGSELNPINEGLPFKDWSIRTTDELKIFPTDISLSNTQLLTFKQYDYKTDKLVDGAVVSTIANSDKPKVVTAISPYITISKDFLKNVKTVHTVETYNSLYLPVKSVDNINDGFAITTSEMDYYSSDLTPGSSYSIGKPRIKTSTVQAYGDTKSIKEEYSYENNLIKNIKTWNRDNTAYIQETYNYDGFGNIIQKTITNSTDSQTKTTSSEYDSKGRFAIKNTDHLGLQTSISYNDWGQILTQTDALGNYISNTYDGWGKILKSKKNLEGTTTYTYELIHGFSVPPAPTPVTGTKVTEYSSDGNQSIIYTDILGQVFKRSSKAFGQGKFISTDTQYDVLGRKISESEPYFEGQNASQWNTISYDDSVFPTKVTLTTFKGKQTETTISGATTTEKEINGYGRTTTKTTDALGNVISSTDKGGTVTFSYNAASEQTQAKYAENIVTTKYDSWGKKSEFNDPSNGTYKYEYNGFGLPKKIISPKGTKEFTYNNAGQLISQKELSTVDGGQATNKIISLAYDDKGRLISKSGTSKGKAYSSTVSYDQQGRLASSSESGNGKYFIQKGITYDDKGRVISYEKQLYSSGIMTKVNIQNVYSGWNGELFQVKDQTSGKVLWQLNDANAKRQVLSAKLGATDVTNTYDNNDFLTNINHSSAVKPGILQISYSFDAIKNELTSRTTGGDFNIIESFDYDDNNRLVNWTNPVTGIKPTANRNVYDIKGRIMENDQVGTMKYENSSKIYQPTGMTLNPAGEQNYTNDLIQTIVYNENNDPIFIDGMKGDVAFQYGITNMRQRVTYGGNFNADGDGTFTKFYSEDGSYEIQVNNTTGAEKHVIYIGGTPYESNIVFIKNYGETAGAYRFLHKDYLGSILAITDETGNKLEQRHFDAWGNMTHYKKGFKSIVTDRDQINMIIANGSLLIDRGYTGHEYFPEVDIIHMNGRLYDPLLRRFLNADENIQDPYNTQNYNKYGYVLNNPLLFNDPSGEYGIGESIVVAVAVAIFTSVATDYYLNRPVDFINLAQSITMAVASSMVSYGVGEIFKAGTQIAKALGETGTLIARAGAHALTQGALSYVQGGNFWSGALSGAFASASSELLGYATRNVGADNILKSDGFALFNGAVSGGVGSVLGGGNFWVGAGQGLIVTAFNYLAHKIDGGDPKPKSPIRKWLKNSSVTYPNGGGIMLDQQYQLDHENTLLEFKTFIEEATKFMDYLDTGSEWLGGVASVKGGWDFVKGLKDLKARAGITIFVGTMLSYNKYQINLQVEMYNQVLDKYLTMHANNPSHMKGITVNIVTYAGPYNNKFTNYRFYDIYSHRYLGGGEL